MGNITNRHITRANKNDINLITRWITDNITSVKLNIILLNSKDFNLSTLQLEQIQNFFEGVPTPRDGANPYVLNFLKKSYEFGRSRGGCPLDPPLLWQNDIFILTIFYLLFIDMFVVFISARGI